MRKEYNHRGKQSDDQSGYLSLRFGLELSPFPDWTTIQPLCMYSIPKSSSAFLTAEKNKRIAIQLENIEQND